MSTKCVHTEHCCREHGCKYGQENCPVVLGDKVQSYKCEDCDVELEEAQRYIAPYNAALDFALDGGADHEGLLFLRMWREGDWKGIADEFPSFDLSTTGQVNNQLS
jgi:hypothetical protein